MATDPPKVKLTSSDGIPFEVDQDVAFKSDMIKDMCTNLGWTESVEVPVDVIDGETLKKIIDYCVLFRHEEFVKKPKMGDQRTDLTDVHLKYFEGVSDDFLMKLLNGANFLNIPGLMDIITQKCANMVDDLTVAQIREQFMLQDDLTAAEKAEVRRKYERIEL